MIDYTAIMEEIREIYIDPEEVYMNFQEDIDEDGHHVWKELESTEKQDRQVVELLKKLFDPYVQALEDTQKKIQEMIDRL